MATETNANNSREPGNLVVWVSGHLRQAIHSGDFPSGDKLPSEAQLTKSFGVSRTVVREAIAALRADGLVEARQGAGVFVLNVPPREALPFQNIDYARISSVVELLELRTGVEIEAAGLAAVRRSPQQEEAIINRHNAVFSRLERGEPTAEADFALHLAIADAANNPRFREFLSMVGVGVIPRVAFQAVSEEESATYIKQIHKEHNDVIEAILNGDEEAARAAMRRHLKGSQLRYKTLLRRGSASL